MWSCLIIDQMKERTVLVRLVLQTLKKKNVLGSDAAWQQTLKGILKLLGDAASLEDVMFFI